MTEIPWENLPVGSYRGPTRPAAALTEGRSHESQEGKDAVLGSARRARLYPLSHAVGQPRHYVSFGASAAAPVSAGGKAALVCRLSAYVGSENWYSGMRAPRPSTRLLLCGQGDSKPTMNLEHDANPSHPADCRIGVAGIAPGMRPRPCGCARVGGLPAVRRAAWAGRMRPRRNRCSPSL